METDGGWGMCFLETFYAVLNLGLQVYQVKENKLIKTLDSFIDCFSV
mgnify:CR=1 FL=1